MYTQRENIKQLSDHLLAALSSIIFNAPQAKQKYIQNRANWTKQLIEANPGKEVSMFLLKDELADSLAAQKRLFKKLIVENKESNIYKVLESRLK